MKYLKVLLFFPLCWSATSQAQTIEEIFPYTIQSHSAVGEISMNSHSKILGEGRVQGQGLVEFNSFDKNHKHSRCYGASCYVDSYFKATASVSKFDEKGKLPLTLVKNKDHELGSGVYFVDGDIDLNQGSIKKNNKDDQVVVYVNGHLGLNGNNSGGGGQIGELGSPLLIFSKSANIKGKYYGYLYAIEDVTLQTPHGDFCGRVSSRNLTMQSHAEIDSRGYCTYDFGWIDEEDEEVEYVLSPLSSIGYVNGTGVDTASLKITSSGTAQTQKFKVTHSGGGVINFAGADINQADSVNLDVNFNEPVEVRYNKAEKVTLTLESVVEEEKSQTLTVDLAFVPRKLKWASSDSCSKITVDFVYDDLIACPVLGQAGGDSLSSLNLLAYDAAVKAGQVQGYNAQIKMELSSGNKYTLTDFKLSDVNVEFTHGQDSKVEFDSKNTEFLPVALIKATVGPHCPAYANDVVENCGSKEVAGIKGVIIGRTVPDRLVIEKLQGNIKDDVAYRGKPIDFDNKPYFVVKGCAVNQKKDEECNLPSYSGEFAGGLKENYDFTIKELLEGTEFELNVSEPSLGEHQFGLKPDSLIFSKADPSAEISLKKMKLNLTIKEHDGLNKLNNKTTALADDDDMLRFGYLVLEDTELSVETNGYITGKLYYLDQFKNSKPVTENHFSFASDIANDANIVATPKESESAIVPVLAVDNDGLGTDGIGVAKYKQAAEFTVTLEVDKWLQPHKDGGLVQPTAHLKFTEDSRKRGNDSTFNRREVSR